MSEIKNGGLNSMAKCKALTGSVVKGLSVNKELVLEQLSGTGLDTFCGQHCHFLGLIHCRINLH